MGEALADAEWILHAASQDLPCLAELGARPRLLFDTEHAGRLLGYPRVGLGPLVEQVLGLGLEKGHGAADWSRRPLPEAWLRYAALDVEVLLELREALAAELVEADKHEWAAQDFAAMAASAPPALRIDPWRRTSGLHRIRRPAALAVVRSLWWERDAIARERDLAPGRVLPDAAIIEAASAPPTTDIADLPAFAGRGARRHVERWRAAVQAARALPSSQWPPSSLPADGPPPPKAWPDKNPEAAARLSAARAALAALADSLSVPVENLLAPDTVRRVCWEPPAEGLAGVQERLAAAGARPWQIERCASLLAECVEVEAATA